MKTIQLEDGTKVTISDESYQALADSVNTIRVPDNIEFEHHQDIITKLIFNSNKQALFRCTGDDFYRVSHYPSKPEKQPKLVPIEKEDIRAGDWVYVTDLSGRNLEFKRHYKLMLKDKGEKYCYVYNDKEIRVGNMCWKYYYKVVFDD